MCLTGPRPAVRTAPTSEGSPSLSTIISRPGSHPLSAEGIADGVGPVQHHVRCGCEVPCRPTFRVDPAGGHFEVAGLKAGGGADVGSVEGDDQRSTLGQAHAMRTGMVARLDMIGDLGEAAAHRHMVGASAARKEQADDMGGLAKRQPCAKLGLNADEFGCSAPLQEHRHAAGSLTGSGGPDLKAAARARTDSRLPDGHRTEQGLDNPPPMIMQRACQTVVPAPAIQGGALVDLALDHPQLELLQQFFCLCKSKTEVVLNGC